MKTQEYAGKMKNLDYQCKYFNKEYTYLNAGNFT